MLAINGAANALLDVSAVAIINGSGDDDDYIIINGGVTYIDATTQVLTAMMAQGAYGNDDQGVWQARLV
jgi:F0F1-type ATP synthase epsilon subunit